MERNVASQVLEILAVDSATGRPKTGDAANITAYVTIDGGSATVLGDTSAAEIDATNAPGMYRFSLTQAETNGKTLMFSGKSSTSGIDIIPQIHATVPPNFSLLGIETDGMAHADVKEWGGSTTPVTNFTIVFSTDFAANYDTTNDVWLTNVKLISGDSGAADNLEAGFDGTGYASKLQVFDVNGGFSGTLHVGSGQTYATIALAEAAASAGARIVIHAGTLTEHSVGHANVAEYYFMPGAILDCSASSGQSCFAGAVNLRVRGFGEFVGNAFVAVSDFENAHYDIECDWAEGGDGVVEVDDDAGATGVGTGSFVRIMARKKLFQSNGSLIVITNDTTPAFVLLESPEIASNHDLAVIASNTAGSAAVLAAHRIYSHEPVLTIGDEATFIIRGNVELDTDAIATGLSTGTLILESGSARQLSGSGDTVTGAARVVVCDGFAIDPETIEAENVDFTLARHMRTDWETGGDLRVELDAKVESSDFIDEAPALDAIGTEVAGRLNTYGAIKPTTAGRTLDVTVGGEAGIDFGNIGNPTTTVNLSGTTIKNATDVKTDTASIIVSAGATEVIAQDIQGVTNKLDTMLENVAGQERFIAEALEESPTGTGGFTSDDRTKLEAIHTKLPSKTNIAGTNNADGDIQMNEATGNFPGSVGSLAAGGFPLTDDPLANFEAFFDANTGDRTIDDISTPVEITIDPTAND